MINDDICKLRDELNRSIEEGENYEVIYKISTDLDELIARYYKETRNIQMKNKKGVLTCLK